MRKFEILPPFGRQNDTKKGFSFGIAMGTQIISQRLHKNVSTFFKNAFTEIKFAFANP